MLYSVTLHSPKSNPYIDYTILQTCLWIQFYQQTGQYWPHLLALLLSFFPCSTSSTHNTTPLLNRQTHYATTVITKEEKDASIPCLCLLLHSKSYAYIIQTTISYDAEYQLNHDIYDIELNHYNSHPKFDKHLSKPTPSQMQTYNKPAINQPPLLPNFIITKSTGLDKWSPHTTPTHSKPPPMELIWQWSPPHCQHPCTATPKLL